MRHMLARRVPAPKVVAPVSNAAFATAKDQTTYQKNDKTGHGFGLERHCGNQTESAKQAHHLTDQDGGSRT